VYLIIEWAELTAARRDANKVKSFVTSKDDVFRAPYDKRPQHHPRMCVFAASTNDDVWMSDETGGRRFWPVKCGKIDLGKLERDRNQFWAEAVARYKAGEKWWFQSNALNDMATEAQRDRYLRGPWDSIIEKYLDSLAKKQVTIDEIRSNVICAGLTPTPISQWKHADMNSVARCLVHNGWKRRQVKVEGSALRKWVYELSPVGVVTEKESGDKT
jgi:predicted P-loop ATPase